MNHKLQIRTTLASLNQTELFRVLDAYLAISTARLEKSTKEISIKCFECGVKVKTKAAVGFGRNQAEALTNAVRNLMEALIDDDKTYGLLRTAMGNSIQPVTANDVVSDQPQQFKALTLTTKHNSDQPKDQRQLKKDELFEQMSRQTTYYTSSSKIKHPNSSVKPRLHESYMSQSVDHQDAAADLKRAHEYIKELEAKIKQASIENESLRANLGKLSIEELTTVSPKPQPQQPPIANPGNLESLEFKIHAKVRSISVEQNNPSPAKLAQPQLPLSRPSSFLTESTHTNLSTLEDSKKEALRVPRLKLEQLPNYHGRSNKSLNQSLLDAYTKNKK